MEGSSFLVNERSLVQSRKRVLLAGRLLIFTTIAITREFESRVRVEIFPTFLVVTERIHPISKHYPDPREAGSTSDIPGQGSSSSSSPLRSERDPHRSPRESEFAVSTDFQLSSGLSNGRCKFFPSLPHGSHGSSDVDYKILGSGSSR